MTKITADHLARGAFVNALSGPTNEWWMRGEKSRRKLPPDDVWGFSTPSVERQTRPSFQEQCEGVPPFEDIIDGFREVMAPRKFGTLSEHVNLKLIDEWLALLWLPSNGSDRSPFPAFRPKWENKITSKQPSTWHPAFRSRYRRSYRTWPRLTWRSGRCFSSRRDQTVGGRKL